MKQKIKIELPKIKQKFKAAYLFTTSNCWNMKSRWEVPED